MENIIFLHTLKVDMGQQKTSEANFIFFVYFKVGHQSSLYWQKIVGERYKVMIYFMVTIASIIVCAFGYIWYM